MTRKKSRPYIDRGVPGGIRVIGGAPPFVRTPPVVEVRVLTLRQIQRHNTLNPALQETDRILLRWGEQLGNGLPNPDAEIREMHYEPLPPDLQERVDGIIAISPWETFTRKWYRTNLDRATLAKIMKISRKQLYIDWQSALWYYRGRFEYERIYG